MGIVKGRGGNTEDGRSRPVGESQRLEGGIRVEGVGPPHEDGRRHEICRRGLGWQGVDLQGS